MRERERRAVGWAALGLVLAVAACGVGSEPDPESGLSPSEFTEIVIELREAEREIGYGDSAVDRFEARREEILAAHDVTPEDLRRFLEARGGEPEALQAIWDTLNARLKHVPADPPDPERRRESERGLR